MTDCATHRMRFETQSALAVEAASTGGASPPTADFCVWPRWTRSWVCARPSPSRCPSGETGEGATPLPRSLGRGSSR